LAALLILNVFGPTEMLLHCQLMKGHYKARLLFNQLIIIKQGETRKKTQALNEQFK